MIKPQAFTIRNNAGLLRELKSHCHISVAFLPADGQTTFPPIVQFNALWDTGATGTVITKAVANRLGLAPIGQTKAYHADGDSIVNVYAVNVLLPNAVGFSFVRVTEGKLKGTDVLIGMDIISQGDFAVTNFGGKTTFSFRVPSGKEIDYVTEINLQREKDAVHAAQPKHAKPTNITAPKKKRR